MALFEQNAAELFGAEACLFNIGEDIEGSAGLPHGKIGYVLYALIGVEYPLLIPADVLILYVLPKLQRLYGGALRGGGGCVNEGVIYMHGSADYIGRRYDVSYAPARHHEVL